MAIAPWSLFHAFSSMPFVRKRSDLTVNACQKAKTSFVHSCVKALLILVKAETDVKDCDNCNLRNKG